MNGLQHGQDDAEKLRQNYEARIAYVKDTAAITRSTNALLEETAANQKATITSLRTEIARLKDAVRRQEQLTEQFRIEPFQNNNPEQWALEVWARLSDSERYYFKEAFTKSSSGLRKRLIGRKDVVKRLYPLVEALEETGMESSGDTPLQAIFDALSEWRK